MRASAFRRTRVAAAVGAAWLCLATGQAFGAAFGLQTQNASGLGHAYSGGAAAAEDVSTIFYNPAGLVRLHSTQAVVSGNLVCPSIKFHDNGSQPAMFQPLGGTGGDAGSCTILPNAYLGVPFTDKWSFGIGVNVPFGLETEYDSDWLGRFQAVKSKLETVNINPVLSWEPTPHLTVGGGVSWQRVKATLTQKLNYAGLFAQGVGSLVAAGQVPASAASALIGSAGGLESNADVSGNDSGWGWNVGILWQANDQTRIGAAYRSRIKYDITGSVNFTNPTASSLGPLPPALAPAGALLVGGVNGSICTGVQGGNAVTEAGCSQDVSVSLKMPDIANVSVFHQFNNRWDLMADLQWIGWSSVQELNIVRSTGVELETLPLHYRNTWRISGGANYRYSDQWTFRGGIAYDQTPVRNEFREPRLPDNSRTWFAAGVQYRFSPNWAIDLGYAYEYMHDPGINNNAGSTAANGLISGSYKNGVNIVGLQVTYTAR
ncbi:MAG TPA: outer membrane protein transport protein [Casimicrobiaceae bacterium]|nr:outer membrane protein transport protein [Casimicrobiaceae bacterium]